MSENTIQIARNGRIQRIVFNRPAKKNALNTQMYVELTAALTMAQQDPEILLVILSGAGDCFTAGNDLTDFVNDPDLSLEAPVVRFLTNLVNFPKIVLAAVQGAAIGVGTTMLLHCDMVVATSDARLQLPFINLALLPEAGSSLLLPARIGYVRAAELLMLGEAFDAQAAVHLGLINRVVDRLELDSVVQKLADQIVAKAPSALLETKRLLKFGASSITAQMQEEFSAFRRQLGTPDFAAAAAAFFKSRSVPCP